MMSCGEASGDLYAGALARELARRDPGVRVIGFGGEQLAAAGAELAGDYHGFAVTGLTEALRVLPRSYGMLRRLAALARDARPDVFVAIDFPDFNFRLAAAVHALGIPVVYYVSPQLWAWRPRRIHAMKRFVVAGARHLPVRAGDLRARRHPGGVRRSPARRSPAADDAARARSSTRSGSTRRRRRWRCCREAGGTSCTRPPTSSRRPRG